MNYYTNFVRRGKLVELVSLLQEEILFYSLLVLVYYFMHDSGSLARLLLFYMVAFSTALIYGSRQLLKLYLTRIYRTGKNSNRLVLISTSKEAGDIIQHLVLKSDWTHILSGIILIDQSDDLHSRPDQIEGIPVVAGRTDLLDYLIHGDVDEVFFSYKGVDEDPDLEYYVNEIQMMGTMVDVNIESFNLVGSGTKTLNRVGGYAVVSFSRNVISTKGMIAKRLLDIIGSLVGMVFFGITAVFAVPAIRMESKGSAIFTQTRVGKNGRRFKLYKFRSMYSDAEERKKDLLPDNEVSGLMFKVGDDPRITRVGRFLRRTSLDELPQFWNVLKGDMSLVGTRPPTEDEFDLYEARHKARLSMTPGMTGMWQVSGRSDIRDFDEVVKLDMEYIDNWSIMKDIKILLKTIDVVIREKGSR